MGHNTMSFLLTPTVFPANPCFSTRRLTVDSRWSTASCRPRRSFSVFSRSSSCGQEFWLEGSSLSSKTKKQHRGKWVSYAERKDMETSVSSSDYAEKGISSRDELRGCLKGHLAMIIHSLSISSFIFLRWSRLNMVSVLLKMGNCLYIFSMQAFRATSLPFASLSNSLNKPIPLNLDVSLPSIGDLQWSFARMIYLFNMQVERNVATFLLVLLVACFSFVVIGGILFYRVRGDTQSLEDCFWEAWACLCSSGTHLRV